MPQEGLAKQELRGFLGVNLRTDRTKLSDEDLAKSINADMHIQPGVIILRYGRTKLYSSALSDLTIRRLGRINGLRYAVAGDNVYRGETSILSGLSGTNFTTIFPFRPFLDTNTWAFIADKLLMRKDDGTNLRTWGIAAPAVDATAAVGSSTGLTGDYRFKYTYCRKIGTALAHESNPSPESNEITLSDQDASLTNIVASTDAQVTHKRIYRTLAGGTLFLYDQEIPNAQTSTTSTNTDAELGTEVETDNDVPPACGWAAPWQEHVWLCQDDDNPHFLWYSKRYRPESIPSGNYIEIGNADDPLQCALPVAGMLGILTKNTKYRIIGNASTGFVPLDAVSRRGTPCPLAALTTEAGLVFVARDGIYTSTLSSADVTFSDAIQAMFYGERVNGIAPINWTYASLFSAAVWKRRYYFSYVDTGSTTPNKLAVYSGDTKRWYHFDHPLYSLSAEEDTDYLLGGGGDGFVYILENGTSDAGADIVLDVETADRFGQAPNIRKLFRYFRVDATVPSGSLTAAFYVDGVSKRSVSITGTRTKLLQKLPAGALGATWRVVFAYTGTAQVKIHGVDALWMPMGDA